MFERITPLAGALIVANVLVFALFKLLGGPVAVWLALWPVESITGADLFRPWQVLTYSFLQVDGFSLFLNMFALFMFGLAVPRATKLGLALSLFLTAGTLLSGIIGYALPPEHQAAFESGRWIGFLVGFGLAIAWLLKSADEPTPAQPAPA